jgi:hypothetical protein
MQSELDVHALNCAQHFCARHALQLAFEPLMPHAEGSPLEDGAPDDELDDEVVVVPPPPPPPPPMPPKRAGPLLCPSPDVDEPHATRHATSALAITFSLMNTLRPRG